jgi:hypothetical protein
MEKEIKKSAGKKTIAVWFSCGVASAIALKKTLEIYGNDYNVLAINSPIAEEHPDNLRFKDEISKWLNIEIIEAKSKKYPNQSIIEVFDKRKYMSGVAGAPCTKELKKQPRYEFELENKIDFHVLGFTYEEKDRFERFTKFERGNTIGVLIDEKLTKFDCFDILNNAGIKRPYIYDLGFPNANCIGCVKSSSPTYWNLVRKEFPDVFKERCEQSRNIGTKLVKVKGERIFLDELKQTDIGGIIKTWECGIFCDTE